MSLFIRRFFALGSYEPTHYLTRLPAGLELATQEEALLLIRCYLPPQTTEAAVADRALCHTLLECAIPIIYAGRARGQLVTAEWLSGCLSSNRLVSTLNSGVGPKRLRRMLSAWLMNIPGASEKGLASGSLPSVFHGKYRSIIQDILSAIERIPTTHPRRAAA